MLGRLSVAHAAVGGDEQRVVAKAVVAAQPRKSDAARALAHAGQVPTVRQDEAYRRDELLPPLPCRHRLHGSQKLIVVGLVIAVVAAVAGAASGCAVQRVHHKPESSAMVGRPLALQMVFALMRAFSAKVVPVSSGSMVMPSFFLADHLMSLRFQNAAQFAGFPALPVAAQIFRAPP